MLRMRGHSLVDALQSALNGEIVLELDGDLLPCEGLECREDELYRVIEDARAGELTLRVSRTCHHLATSCRACNETRWSCPVPTIFVDMCRWVSVKGLCERGRW